MADVDDVAIEERAALRSGWKLRPRPVATRELSFSGQRVGVELILNNLAQCHLAGTPGHLPAETDVRDAPADNAVEEAARADAARSVAKLKVAHLALGDEAVQQILSWLTGMGRKHTMPLALIRIIEASRASDGQAGSGDTTRSDSTLSEVGAPAAPSRPFKLRQLNLSHNFVGPDALPAIAEFTRWNASLTHLELAANEIQCANHPQVVDRVAELARAVSCSSLRTLDLASNRLGAEGLVALFDHLHSPTLNELHLSLTLPSELVTHAQARRTAARVARCLANSAAGLSWRADRRGRATHGGGRMRTGGWLPRLQRLSLNGNEVGWRGIRAIVTSVVGSPPLPLLLLGNAAPLLASDSVMGDDEEEDPLGVLERMSIAQIAETARAAAAMATAGMPDKGVPNAGATEGPSHHDIDDFAASPLAANHALLKVDLFATSMEDETDEEVEDRWGIRTLRRPVSISSFMRMMARARMGGGGGGAATTATAAAAAAGAARQHHGDVGGRLDPRAAVGANAGQAHANEGLSALDVAAPPQRAPFRSSSGAHFDNGPNAAGNLGAPDSPRNAEASGGIAASGSQPRRDSATASSGVRVAGLMNPALSAYDDAREAASTSSAATPSTSAGASMATLGGAALRERHVTRTNWRRLLRAQLSLNARLRHATQLAACRVLAAARVLGCEASCAPPNDTAATAADDGSSASGGGAFGMDRLPPELRLHIVRMLDDDGVLSDAQLRSVVSFASDRRTIGYGAAEWTGEASCQDWDSEEDEAGTTASSIPAANVEDRGRWPPGQQRVRGLLPTPPWRWGEVARSGRARCLEESWAAAALDWPRPSPNRPELWDLGNGIVVAPGGSRGVASAHQRAGTGSTTQTGTPGFRGAGAGAGGGGWASTEPVAARMAFLECTGTDLFDARGAATSVR